MSSAGTWVPEKDRDTSWYIFQRLFMCRVKYIDSMSADYIKIFGMSASGDSVVDNETANELVIRMLSIDQMVEYYKLGVTVQVVNFKDTKEIYERISDHLNAWKHKMATDFHVREAPIDDLLLLDKLASVVYKHAVTLLTQNDVDSILFRRTTSVMKFTRQTIMKPLKTTVINPIEEPKVPERLSMSDSFSAGLPSVVGLTNKWR